ncbi:MAG: hypothetical protein ACP5DX_07880 [Paracoccaceae bacterium]
MKKDKRSAPVARDVRKRGDKKKATYASFVKSPGIIQLETRLEANAACTFDCDPRVVGFRPQPMTIELNSGRIFSTKEALFEAYRGTRYKPRPYTPDFEVTLRSGRIFVETRHSAFIEKRPETLDLPDIFKGFGLRLVVIDETGFPETYCQNIRLLRGHLRTEIPAKLAKTFADACREPRPFRDIQAEVGTERAMLLAAIAQGLVEADIVGERLSDRAIVWSATTRAHLMRLPL